MKPERVMVWVVIENDYEGDVCGVYSTEAAANQAMAEWGSGMLAMKFYLDVGLDDSYAGV